MTEKAAVQTVVLGIGNLLMGDDGVGVHAAQALMEMDLPRNVTVLDVGTAFLDVLPYLEQAGRIIILDAMQAHGEPGTVYRSELHACSSPQRIDSLHNLDIARLLTLAQNPRPCAVTVFGVEPGRICWSMELTPGVSAALPLLLQTVRQELEENDCKERQDRG